MSLEAIGNEQIGNQGFPYILSVRSRTMFSVLARRRVATQIVFFLDAGDSCALSG